MSASTIEYDYIKYNLPTATYLPESLKEYTPKTVDFSTCKNTACNDKITHHFTEIVDDGEKNQINTAKNRNESITMTEDIRDILLTTESSSIKTYTTIKKSPKVSPKTTIKETTKKSWNTIKSYEEHLATKIPSQFSEKQLSDTDNFEIDRNDTISTDIEGDHLDELKERNAKNHGSGWSKNYFPSDKEVYGYGRSELLNETKPSNTVSQSIDDKNIETLSDYVQAMFNAMKETDEKHDLINETRSSEQKKSLKENSITSYKESLAYKNMSTDIVNDEKNFRNTSESSLVFIGPDLIKNLIMFKSSTNEESPSTKSIISNMAKEPFLNEVSSTSAENVTHSKFNEILTTSTEISHMTEMCYKGRCIIAKA